MKRKAAKWGSALLLIAVVAVSVVGLQLYRNYFGPVVAEDLHDAPFYVATGHTEHDVLNNLTSLGLVPRPRLAAWLLEKKNYTGANVEPGLYVLKMGMSLNDIVNNLRGGHGEEMVRITFNAARTLPELAGKVGRNIEADSSAIARLLLDPQTAQRYGFNSSTFISMFLPDTYFAEWDTDGEAFVDRMAGEYKRFWNEERQAKAGALGLSQSKVSTLASIVQAEQQTRPEEQPIIAGLYLNRLRKGMKLQSDPTVVYAIGDFSINRVLNVHLAFDSPYNTYLYPGLPPGPINLPYKSSVDAVLNAERNDYLFMCAKADFSGYHAFAKNLADHSRNANAYRNALNERKIYK